MAGGGLRFCTVRRILHGIPNVRFQMATVKEIRLQERQVITDDGVISYDYLVLAAGSTTNYFGMESIAQHGFGLKGLEEAVVLRTRLLECFERAAAEDDPQRRRQLLTFVIAGGGPTGVEFAGALVELIRLVLAQDFPELDVRDVQVLLLEGGPALLPTLAPRLQREAQRALEKKGVVVRCRAQVTGCDRAAVQLADGSVIPTRTLIWAAGVRASDLGQQLALPLGKGGRIKVEPTLQVASYPEVYVIGDLAYFEQGGAPLPMVAPVAIQQGQHAAANIRRQLDGLPPRPFIYRDSGKLATIGRNSAVFEYGRIQVAGFLAWVLWLTVHLYWLIGFRNRLVVLINWAWEYLFYERAVRIITRRR